MTTPTTNSARCAALWQWLKTMAIRLFEKSFKDDILTLAAALAFYTALSLAPLVLVTVAVLGFIGLQSSEELVVHIKVVVGLYASETVHSIIEGAKSQSHKASLSGILGLGFLLFSASGVFAQLQSSLNLIFDAAIEAKGLGFLAWIRKRLLSMGMVLSLGFLAVVSLLINAIISYFLGHQESIWPLINLMVSFVLFALLFAIMYKFLPDRPLHWRPAFLGGVITALFFTLGKSLVGLYLGQSALGSAYGAAGSLIVFLAWVYYSSFIIFLGAEMTWVVELSE